MSIAAKTFRRNVLVAGGLFALLAVQSTLAAEYDSYADSSPHDAVARRLDPPPTARQLAREDEFDRRGQYTSGRIDRNVQLAGHSEARHNATPRYDEARNSGSRNSGSRYSQAAYRESGDGYGDGYGPAPQQRTSRRTADNWSPDRKSVSRGPSYFDGLYRRREALRSGAQREFGPEYDGAEYNGRERDGREYGQRLASFQEELPPGRDPQFEAHSVREDDGYESEFFEGYGPYEGEYYGPGEQHRSGKHYGGGGGGKPYGGYSEGPPPWYFIPPGNWHWWDDFTIFGGVHGFKGPLDQGRNGNFGFHEGLNWGGPLWDYMQIGYQVGAQVVHSNFNGDQVYTPHDDGRTQYFVTAGLFHRAETCGIQGGVVGDWLQDDYHGQIDLTQLRAEISYLTKSQNEFGVWIATNTDKADVSTELAAATNLPPSVKSANVFNGFWRTKFGRRGEGRLWGGATSGGDIIFGGDIRVPLSKRFAIESSFAYLSADGEQGRYDNTAESWSTVFNLVWYPGWTACKSGKHVYRPLFNVADNSTFVVEPNQADGNRWMGDNAN